MAKLIIDGRPVEVEDGATILQAARQAGLTIPTLCHHPVLEPYAACRVCMVEASFKGKSDLVTACNTAAQSGMEISTSSERALQARRLNVEMLLARAPAAEPVRRLAAELGIDRPRFPVGDPEEKCILCGMCVRACEQIVGASAISFLDRGTERVVSTPFGEESEACIGCTACAYFCPTGAITVEDAHGRTVLHDEMVLGPATAIRVPSRQAVPLVPFIDKEACIHFKTGACQVCAKVCDRGGRRLRPGGQGPRGRGRLDHPGHRVRDLRPPPHPGLRLRPIPEHPHGDGIRTPGQRLRPDRGGKFSWPTAGNPGRWGSSTASGRAMRITMSTAHASAACTRSSSPTS